MKPITFLLPLLFSPCLALSAPTKVAPPVTQFDRKVMDVVYPESAQVTSAEVGEAIYRQTNRIFTTYYRAKIKQDVVSEMDNGYKLTLSAGSSGELLYRKAPDAPMVCFPTSWSGVMGFFGDKNVLGCLIDRAQTGVFDATTFAQYDIYFPLKTPIEYSVETELKIEDTPDTISCQILYQGLSKGEVKISYREFVNNLARPAFNQDVSYELNPNGVTTIGFKGVRMRVLKADSQRIEYILDQAMPAMGKAQPDTNAKPKSGVWWQ